MNFLKSNFWEINRSPLLHYLGAMLSLLHILNYFFWRGSAPFLSGTIAKPLLCWEFFENCSSTGLLSSHLPQQLFSIYAFVAVLSLLSFIWQRFVRLSWTTLLLASSIHAFLYAADASLRQDIQGLLIFLSLSFLFIPNKAAIIRVTVILFYLLTAHAELTPEWLSGSNLVEFIPFPFKALEWVTALGIAIKLTLPFLLISPYGQRLALAASGLISLHIFHFYFRHDFSSLALIFLVLFFIIDFYVRKKLERETLYQSYAQPEPSKLWWPIAALFYIFCQTTFTPTTWLGSMIRVTGPVATSECQHISFAKFNNKVEQIENSALEALDQNIKCHPLVAFNSAKDICQKFNNQPEFISLSSYFLSRSLSEDQYRTIFSIENICEQNLKFSDAAVIK